MPSIHSSTTTRSSGQWFRRFRSGFRRLTWRHRQKVSKGLKRALDVSAAGSALVLLSPLFLLTAALIRLDSKGTALYRQTRVGKNGRTFTLWKFRSMFVDAEARMKELLTEDRVSKGIRFKMKDDPRMTRVGKWLRRTSMDELPQLWNVLVGQMSLVGPRPPIPQEVALYDYRERRRLEVTPGLTCIWQVSGRSEIPFDQQVEMDLEYVHDQSVGLDLRLLLKTIPAVVMARGAY